MDIFYDVDTARPNMREEKTEARLLLFHGMTAIINDDVEVGAVGCDKLAELFSVSLIGNGRYYPLSVIP